MKASKKGARRVTLASLVAARWPAEDGASAIAGGSVLVDGVMVTNPAALVLPSASLRLVPVAGGELAGTRKLSWALSRFGVSGVGARVLDVGASTGGFTTAWLAAGAALVYAVDVGHGQLRGSLRQDARVVNLERVNVGSLTPSVVAGPVDRVSVDVSYLALSAAVTQLGGVVGPGPVELLGLVKPMFELRLATIPTSPAVLASAAAAAQAGVGAAGWTVVDVDECPVRGGRGAVEFFLHARRDVE